ncbi:MAG: hypothetical protein AAF721_31565 [Myxococcota bacterium]
MGVRLTLPMHSKFRAVLLLSSVIACDGPRPLEDRAEAPSRAEEPAETEVPVRDARIAPEAGGFAAEPEPVEPEPEEPVVAAVARQRDARDHVAEDTALPQVRPSAPETERTNGPSTSELPELPKLPRGELVEQAAAEVVPYGAPWAQRAATAEPIEFANDVYGGVVGKSGDQWLHIGDTGELEPVEMDREPLGPIIGTWPANAWWVHRRPRPNEDPEFRLMRWRGRRWVPQFFLAWQWIQPDRSFGMESSERNYLERPSPRGGMLMHAEDFHEIMRVSGQREDPKIGPHRGDAVDFLETGRGRVYVLSEDEGTFYAQAECDSEACVATAARRLPEGRWRFGRRVARGKYTATVVARSGGDVFLLHHRGKNGGWLLEPLAADDVPSGMWSSGEGGLWTRAGDRIRWRTTEGIWRDVVMPEGLRRLSVALTRDGATVWVAGVADGTPKIFTTTASEDPEAP